MSGRVCVVCARVRCVCVRSRVHMLPHARVRARTIGSVVARRVTVRRARVSRRRAFVRRSCVARVCARLYLRARAPFVSCFANVCVCVARESACVVCVRARTSSSSRRRTCRARALSRSRVHAHVVHAFAPNDRARVAPQAPARAATRARSPRSRPSARPRAAPRRRHADVVRSRAPRPNRNPVAVLFAECRGGPVRLL